MFNVGSLSERGGMIACAPVAARFRPEKDFSVDLPDNRYAKTSDPFRNRVSGIDPPSAHPLARRNSGGGN
jgi:hypothetical protein